MLPIIKVYAKTFFINQKKKTLTKKIKRRVSQSQTQSFAKYYQSSTKKIINQKKKIISQKKKQDIVLYLSGEKPERKFA